MITVRHAGPVAVTEWKPQENRNVQEWGGEEEAATGIDGGKGKYGDGLEVYGEQLQTVPSFKYQGRILMEGGDDCPAVTGNLGKARKSWGRMQRILSREGENK